MLFRQPIPTTEPNTARAKIEAAKAALVLKAPAHLQAAKGTFRAARGARALAADRLARSRAEDFHGGRHQPSKETRTLERELQDAEAALVAARAAIHDAQRDAQAEFFRSIDLPFGVLVTEFREALDVIDVALTAMIEIHQAAMNAGVDAPISVQSAVRSIPHLQQVRRLMG